MLSMHGFFITSARPAGIGAVSALPYLMKLLPDLYSKQSNLSKAPSKYL